MKKITPYILILFLAWLPAQKICAQVNAYSFVAAPEVYQPINGNLITNAGDDDFYPNYPIGFTFVYNGVPTDKFGVCTNGFIALDSLMHNIIWVPNSNSVNFIDVFATDLYFIPFTSRLEYVTIGTAPNRVLVIQWKNVTNYGSYTDNINFQVMLFETSNCIKFIYGTCTGTAPISMGCYVGLLGNSLNDFNTLTSSVNNWPAATGSTNLLNDFLVFNPTSTIPQGLAYNFGCSNFSSLPFSYLTGWVFNDLNNNGIADAGENGLPNCVIHETNFNIYSVTDASGNYMMFFPDSSQAYNLAAIPWTYWSIATLPLSYNVIPLSQSCSNLDFGLHVDPNIHDLQISAFSPHGARPNNWNFYLYCTYHNNGPFPESGTVQLIKDSRSPFINATPAPDSINGDTITWNYSNLAISGYGSIGAFMSSGTIVQQGDTLFEHWIISPIANDSTPEDNEAYDYQRISNSFDPNSKSVSPDGDILNGTTLHYNINFQNTGTAPAVNVVILDTLDSNLDPSTIVIEGSSHPLSFWTMTGSGNLRFVFQNIMLPDSTTNESASHGCLSYRISPYPLLPMGTIINNTANIVFDFNAPITTTTATNMITDIMTGEIISSGPGDGLTIFPNPAANQLVISDPGFTISEIELYDVVGEKIFERHLTSGYEHPSVDVSKFSPGIYFVHIKSDKEHVIRKLVVQR